jgi:hypothetical protein
MRQGKGNPKPNADVLLIKSAAVPKSEGELLLFELIQQPRTLPLTLIFIMQALHFLLLPEPILFVSV